MKQAKIQLKIELMIIKIILNKFLNNNYLFPTYCFKYLRNQELLKNN